MKNKDHQLLEEAYFKILSENEKFQPNDPDMQELSKIGMGEQYPEDQDPRNSEYDSDQEISTTKRIQSIAVRDSNGKLINFYAPNNIGSSVKELFNKANKEAKEINGEVTIRYYEK
jgi:hypothetical protein